jgi:hypothetical protein
MVELDSNMDEESQVINEVKFKPTAMNGGVVGSQKPLKNQLDPEAEDDLLNKSEEDMMTYRNGPSQNTQRNLFGSEMKLMAETIQSPKDKEQQKKSKKAV